MARERMPSARSGIYEGVVRRYFHDMLDRGNVDIVEELFHPKCVMHRPGGPVVGLEGVRGVAERRKETFSRFETTIHDIIAAEDQLVARLSHHGVGGGIWRSRLGQYNVAGKTVTWDSVAIFRFEDNRIIEEWVTRDELGMILQFGLINKDVTLRSATD